MRFRQLQLPSDPLNLLVRASALEQLLRRNNAPILERSSNTLRLSGKSYGKIKLIGELFKGDAEVSNTSWWRYYLWRTLSSLETDYIFNSWEEITQARCGKQYHTGESMLDAYRRTLIVDHYDTMFQQSDFEEWDQHVRWKRWFNVFYLHRVKWLYLLINFLCVIGFMRCLPILVCLWLGRKRFGYTLFNLVLLARQYAASGRPASRGELRFRHTMTQAVSGRRIFRTENGYIGLCPQFAKVGDRIVVFAGGRVPLVLRSSGKDWRLVGNAYVHGIMKGELESKHSARLELDSFCIV